MNELRFRPATRGDKTRILEIAAQVWEGEDYIPDVIDNWLTPGVARLVVATLDDQVVAIARYERTAPGYVWLEGLRTDPAYQNRGIAKAMTEHMIRRAQADRADRVGLSTYFDNYASQRVIETYGFVRVASFAYCRAAAGLVCELGIASANIESLSVDEVVPFILASEALRLGHGFLPHSWRFYPLTRGPEIALTHMEHLLGIRDGGQLVAVLCAGDHTPHGPSTFSIDFLAGEPAAVVRLVRHALNLAQDAEYVESMIPSWQGRTTVARDVFRELGFEAWNEWLEDVFVYELDLAGEKRVRTTP